MERPPSVSESEIIEEFYRVITLSYAKHTLNFSEFKKEAFRDDVYMIPIFKEGHVVTTGSLFIDKKNEDNRPYYGSIHRIAVHPKFRGKRLGVKVNQMTLDYAQKLGCEHVYCSAVLNVEGSEGGGNSPNLAQLNICLSKFGYQITGLRLVDLPDFGRKNDLQYTSTAVLWKPLKDINESKQICRVAKEKLFFYYQEQSNFEIYKNLEYKNKLKVITTKKTGAKLAASSKLEDFSHTSYLPSYFLPFYGQNKEVVYFGFHYKKVLTRTSDGPNVADLDYRLLRSFITDEWLDFSKKVQEQIVSRTKVIYSDPFIKENNL